MTDPIAWTVAAAATGSALALLRRNSVSRGTPTLLRHLADELLAAARARQARRWYVEGTPLHVIERIVRVTRRERAGCQTDSPTPSQGGRRARRCRCDRQGQESGHGRSVRSGERT